jgi:hypothetical protein
MEAARHMKEAIDNRVGIMVNPPRRWKATAYIDVANNGQNHAMLRIPSNLSPMSVPTKEAGGNKNNLSNSNPAKCDFGHP